MAGLDQTTPGNDAALDGGRRLAPALPTVVIATRDRYARLLATLQRIHGLSPRPPVVVVDNGSTDGTAAAVRHRFPGVAVVALDEDIGSAARTVGVEAARTPLVAFTDDDSWWAPGALERAAELFTRFPRLGLVAARILVEPGGRLDPTCRVMRESPLRDHVPLPGPPVLGFLACAAVARRTAILASGGFHPHFGFGGEEQLLAVDLATRGWRLAYADDVVAHHEPDRRPRAHRTHRELRNEIWSAWLRRPLPRALRVTAGHLRGDGRRAVAAAARGLPWVLRERRVLPPDVERSLRLLDR